MSQIRTVYLIGPAAGRFPQCYRSGQWPSHDEQVTKVSGALVAWSCGVGGRSEMPVSASVEVGDHFFSYSEPRRVHNHVEIATDCKARLMY